MIQEFVNTFMAKRGELEKVFSKKHPEEYKDVVKAVVNLFYDENEFDKPDPSRIYEIDDGDYQGTLVFIIGASGYQPDDYWYVKVGYGSCSGCDTLQACSCVEDYMTLALHIVQGLKKMEDYY